MSVLQTLEKVARQQVGQGGQAVTTEQIRMMYPSYSRVTVHKYIRYAVESGYLSRVKRGHYMVAKNNEGLIAIGLCVLLPMDVYEYQSRIALMSAV